MDVNYKNVVIGLLSLVGTSAASAHGLMASHNTHALFQSPTFFPSVLIATGIVFAISRPQDSA
jgi:hypothetical protein